MLQAKRTLYPRSCLVPYNHTVGAVEEARDRRYHRRRSQKRSYPRTTLLRSPLDVAIRRTPVLVHLVDTPFPKSPLTRLSASMTGNLKAPDNVAKTSGVNFDVHAAGLAVGVWGATAGLPHHQFGRQDEASGVGTTLSVEAVEEHLGGAAAQFGCRLVDEREAGS